MHWNKEVFRLLGPTIPNQIGQLPPHFDSSIFIDRVARLCGTTVRQYREYLHGERV